MVGWDPFLKGFFWVARVGGHGGWAFLEPTVLTPGQVYTFSLVADFVTNRYVSLTVSTPRGPSRVLNLRAYEIGPEYKFTESAFWLSLEAENLWHGDQPGAYGYRVFYDNVSVVSR